MISSYLAFLGISLAVILTPGPDTALTIRNTVFGGRPSGVATAAGVAVGQTVWALAASLGIIALLIASEPLFLAIKYSGAAYLVYLGMQALRQALRPSRSARACTAGNGSGRGPGPRAAFRQGVISNLGNPKMAIYFASLLPQFAPPGDATFTALPVLGLSFVLLTLAWLTIYAVVISRIGDFLRRPAVGRAIAGLTGAVLIGFGLRVAIDER